MGVFAIYNDTNAESTMIPNLFIDEYMKDANDAQIKIYLYLVRQMSAGLTTSISDMADRFNHTEREVLRSLRYWEKKGLLVLETDAAGMLSSIHLCELRRKQEPQESHVISILPKLESSAPAKTESQRSASSSRKSDGAGAPALSSHTEEMPSVSADPVSDKTAADNQALLFIVEQYIGKPLSSSEIRTIMFIKEHLHFSDDLVDYLVDYCVGLGKKDFRYIEKVALNWAESGITTAGEARKAAVSARRKKRAPAGKINNSFNMIEQHDYNFQEIEEQLLQ